MADKSKIEWTDATWNPIRGCSRVSPGCDNCYAIREAARHAGTHRTTYKEQLPPRPAPYAGFVKKKNGRMDWTGRVELIHEKLKEPLRWRHPRRIFVNSMSDLFQERVSDEWIDTIFGIMAARPCHTFQVLTKRAVGMRRWFLERGVEQPIAAAEAASGKVGDGFDSLSFGAGGPWPLPNVWIGVSVEDQERADERIPLLLETPAAVRFVSAEPLLGPIDFGAWLYKFTNQQRRLDWVIAGGESGPGARPCDIAWVRSIRDQCQAAGVACFVKQLGTRPYSEGVCPGSGVGVIEDAHLRLTLKDHKGGDPSEWPEDLRVRDYPR